MKGSGKLGAILIIVLLLSSLSLMAALTTLAIWILVIGFPVLAVYASSVVAAGALKSHKANPVDFTGDPWYISKMTDDIKNITEKYKHPNKRIKIQTGAIYQLKDLETGFEITGSITPTEMLMFTEKQIKYIYKTTKEDDRWKINRYIESLSEAIEKLCDKMKCMPPCTDEVKELLLYTYSGIKPLKNKAKNSSV